MIRKENTEGYLSGLKKAAEVVTRAGGDKTKDILDTLRFIYAEIQSYKKIEKEKQPLLTIDK